ncbi:MAG: ABC transporter ATP-binding protein [Crocinitomicaceae bacterium]|nr:ABC transporter ATP-binding protein [Crocinitomicaceae bacterium]
MSTTILEIKDLSKNYSNVKALDKLSLKVERGMIFGILGPNGSGKTTTLGILLGVLNATGGSYSWFGNGSADINRKRIGALLETPNFYSYLNAVQNLTIVAKIKELENVEERIDHVLKVVDLYERRLSDFKTFSLGMKQRLAIASALLSDPEVLVLDEPTNGLDPQGIAEIRNLILDIAKEGKTILIASHQLDEIEKVCSDVIILKNGVALKQSAIENILEGSKQFVIGASDLAKAKQIAEKLNGVEKVNEENGQLILETADQLSAEEINRYFFEQGVVLSELRLAKKSLEAQFLEITKKA